MKTMGMLCKRFARIHPGSSAELDELGSYPGYYRICVETKSPGAGTLYTWYTFKTCKEFKEWSEGVIL